MGEQQDRHTLGQAGGEAEILLALPEIGSPGDNHAVPVQRCVKGAVLNDCGVGRVQSGEDRL